MKAAIFLLFFFVFQSGAFATEVACTSEDSLAGSFATQAAKGFQPNTLRIQKAQNKNFYQFSLTSHWAPKPFDDGTLGTIGNFDGGIAIPQPWSCVGVVTVKAQEEPEGGYGALCILLLRFVSSSRIEVTSFGYCEVFHGHRADPDGTYTRVAEHEL
jgi:hypothetical protein